MEERCLAADVLETRINYVEGSLQAVTQRLDRITWWLATTAGGMAVACILLLVNVVLLRGGKP